MRDLPGFYWDEGKGRYFKIPPGGGPSRPARPPKQKTPARSTSRAGRDSKADSKGQRQRLQPPAQKGHQRREPSGKRRDHLQSLLALLRGRERGCIYASGMRGRPASAHTVQASVHEVRAKSMSASGPLAGTPSLSLAGQATSAVEFFPLQTQTDSGLKCMPSLLCGSSSEKCITQLTFLPSDGDNLPFDMNPAWRSQYRPNVTIAYKHTSPSTCISPWRSAPDEHPSMVGFCWLGGGALPGEFSFHSAQGVVGAAASAHRSHRPFRTAFPRQASVHVRGTIWCSDMLPGRPHVALGTSAGSLLYDLERGGQGNRPLLSLPAHGSDVLTQVYYGESSVLRGLRNGWINLIDTRQAYRAPRSAAGSVRMKSSVTSVLPLSDAAPNAIVGASVNGHITMWDIRKQSQVMHFLGHRNSFTRYNLALSQPGGSLLAAGGADNCVRVWSTRTGRLLGTHGPFASAMPCCTFAFNGWGETDVLCCGGESGVSILGPPGYS
eukprot:jgi/Tetstr1/444258/TSEL_032150.t1